MGEFAHVLAEFELAARLYRNLTSRFWSWIGRHQPVFSEAVSAITQAEPN
jgi:hypothetical protein